MTAFSDLPPPADHPVHPAATQIHAYLRDYAERFGVTPRIRLDAPVREVRAGWTVDGEPFDAVVVATGRFGRRLRERVLRVAGSPADFGAPAPDADILVAGLALCQDYLGQIRDGAIECRPAIAAIDGHTVTFADGASAAFEAIVCATGYQVDVPYLHPGIQELLGPDLTLVHRTLHPDLPGLGVIGQFLAQGPYFPLLELQARWIVGIWAGDVVPPVDAVMRRALAEPAPAIEAHNALAATLAEQAGVAPELLARPDLAEPLLFGPMLPPRYRLDGPGAQPEAEARFREQLEASPRSPVDPAQVDELRAFGLGAVAEALEAARG